MRTGNTNSTIQYGCRFNHIADEMILRHIGDFLVGLEGEQLATIRARELTNWLVARCFVTACFNYTFETYFAEGMAARKGSRVF
jgi:hypothetical protein